MPQAWNDGIEGLLKDIILCWFYGSAFGGPLIQSSSILFEPEAKTHFPIFQYSNILLGVKPLT